MPPEDVVAVVAKVVAVRVAVPKAAKALAVDAKVARHPTIGEVRGAWDIAMDVAWSNVACKVATCRCSKCQTKQKTNAAVGQLAQPAPQHQAQAAQQAQAVLVVQVVLVLLPVKVAVAMVARLRPKVRHLSHKRHNLKVDPNRRKFW